MPQPPATATPRLAGTPLPTLSPHALTTTPGAGPWPECTPLPGTPTTTPTATPWPTVRPAPTANPVGSMPVPSGNLIELADPPGLLSAATLATDPATGAVALAWISWGMRADATQDGQVWVRTQTTDGRWEGAQTVNGLPVTKDLGGVGLAVLADGTLVVTWAHGPASGDPHVWWRTSTDRGRTWSAPEPTPLKGSVLASQADPQGGLHLLLREVTDATSVIRYGHRSTAGTWTLSPPLSTGAWAALAITTPPDATAPVVRIAVVDAPTGVVVLTQHGGTWAAQALPTEPLPPGETRRHPSLLATTRPDGTALVALAWSGYALPGAVAVHSRDGGQTWSGPEWIAARTEALDDDGMPTGLSSGYQPTLAYDAATDGLVAVWLQRDLSTMLWRTFLSARPLSDTWVGPDWHYALTPTQDAGALPLSDPGWVGQVQGDPTTGYWVLLQDGRNGQERLHGRPMPLSGYLRAGDS